MTDTSRRPYDATKRRERAEEERRATRRRVIAAAQRLFVAKGYADTTMGDIARTAGVALQSLYKAASSKAELLQLVVDAVVAGDDEEVMMSDRPSFTAIAENADPERQVRMMAALIASIQERSAPVQSVFRQAAAVDDTIAASLDRELRRRHESFAVIVRMIPEDRLRHPVEESTDTAWAIGSSEVYQLLRIRRGWDADHYQEWLSRTLVEQLLSPSPDALG